MKKKTHEEFVIELAKINPNIIVLGEYLDSRTKIKLKCNKDKHIWHQAPYRLLRGCGCPKCSGRVKKTHEEYVNEVKEKSPHINVIGIYTGGLEKIDCECIACGHKWSPIATSLIRNISCGCPQCSYIKRRSSPEEFIQLFSKSKKSSDIELLTPFVKYNIPIKCKCKIDRHIWDATPRNLVSGQGCPKCGGTMNVTHNDFVDRMKKVNSNIIINGKYINNITKIKCMCAVDEHIWMGIPANLLNGNGCPLCCTSKGEKEIKKYLDAYNIEYEYQKEFDGLYGLSGGNLSFDFYIKEKNLLIEYQGQFHDGTAKLQSKKKLIKQQEHDIRKRKYANENNIELLEIWYWDFSNIESILNNYFIKE